MDYYPADTIADRIVDVRSNTAAPIAHVPQEQFAIPAGLAVLTPRNLAIGIGGVVIGAILLVGFRSSSNGESIKVAPIQNTEPSSAQVNQLVLGNSKAALADLKIATDLKIDEIQQAAINERSQEILLEAQKQIKDPKSGCYRSPYGVSCFVTVFIAEQEQRYSYAISGRDWNKANTALFNIKASRVALDGVKPTPFTPAVASAAIIKENEARINLAQQSDNAIAHELNGNGAKTKR
jgi:hypothetical protein